MSAKINARRRPATMADVERAKQQAETFGVKTAMCIFFSVLCDKEHADAEAMQRVWKEVNDLSESITNGYVSIADLKYTLKTEYDIMI